MIAFTVLTVGLFFGLVCSLAYFNAKHIQENWARYKSDPLYMFSAFMFKPADDPRSRLQFAADNFIDVMMETVHNIFAVFMKPIMNIFRLFSNSLSQTTNGLFNIRSIFAKIYGRFNELIEVFMRRFQGVFHELRMTFVKLNNAMGKTFGVATSSIYAGLSAINTIMSVFDLMINICVVILILLAVFMIFLPFLLIPFILLILTVVNIINLSDQGDQLTGIAGVFCFTKETPIATATGTLPISEIKVGTELFNNNKAIGIFKFKQSAENMFDLHGIKVSGSHIVYKQDGKACHVEDHPDAVAYTETVSELYCLMTSNRRIQIQSNVGIIDFADWEELDDDDEGLLSWNQKVFSMLNPSYTQPVPSYDNLHSESCFSEMSLVSTIFGNIPISNIRPGTYVDDGFGNTTRVYGVVEIDDSEVCSSVIELDAEIAAGSWIHKAGVWQQPCTKDAVKRKPVRWFNLFTEKGTFMLANGTRVRDFTDVGNKEIEETYSLVMNELNKKNLTSQ